MLKHKIYAHCLRVLSLKIEEIKKAMGEVSEGIADDSKSSAGDKHETSRAMAQIEMEKIAKQLSEAVEQKTMLEKLQLNSSSSKIIKGSLVKTNTVYFFISVAIGRITVDNISVIAISPHSPISIKLIGLKTNDTAQLNGIKYFIERIE